MSEKNFHFDKINGPNIFMYVCRNDNMSIYNVHFCSALQFQYNNSFFKANLITFFRVYSKQ